MSYEDLHTNIDTAKRLARDIVKRTCAEGNPVAMEVVKTRKGYDVQPFGMHLLIKSHKHIHTEPVPEEFRHLLKA